MPADKTGMSRVLRRFLVVICGALTLSCAIAPVHGQILGPDQLPRQLPGLWRINLCVSWDHAWIYFEHAEIGERHTLGRYTRGFGGEFDWRTGRWIWPHAPACGVVWDMDLRFHAGVRSDGCVLRTCYVWHPRIYRGRANGYGHCGIRMNCATYARDAWHFYAGERYALPLIATPRALRNSVCGSAGG
jgi:hypothetical protein